MNGIDEYSELSLNTSHCVIYSVQSDTAFGWFPSFRKVYKGKTSETLVELGGGKGCLLSHFFLVNTGIGDCTTAQCWKCHCQIVTFPV